MGCMKVVDYIDVDSDGDLMVTKEGYDHILECSECHKIYLNLGVAMTMTVPDYVPAVMDRIRKMEEDK